MSWRSEACPCTNFLSRRASRPKPKPLLGRHQTLPIPYVGLICRMAPSLVSGTKWNGYGSLTIFDAETNAVFITSLDTAEAKSNAVILTLRANVKSNADIHVLKLEKPKGLALIRRLAPTVELYDEANSLASSDVCTAYKPIA